MKQASATRIPGRGAANRRRKDVLGAGPAFVACCTLRCCATRPPTSVRRTAKQAEYDLIVQGDAFDMACAGQSAWSRRLRQADAGGIRAERNRAAWRARKNWVNWVGSLIGRKNYSKRHFIRRVAAPALGPAVLACIPAPIGKAVATSHRFAVSSPESEEYNPVLFAGPAYGQPALDGVSQASGIPFSGFEILLLHRQVDVFRRRAPLKALAEGHVADVLVAAAGMALPRRATNQRTAFSALSVRQSEK